MIQEKILKGFQVRSLFDYYNNLVSKPGERPAFSRYVWNNYNLLAQANQEIINKINEQRDPAINDYNVKMNDLYLKFADRDEQGNVKFDAQHRPIVTENAVEFGEEAQKLETEFPDIQQKIAADRGKGDNAMNGDYKVNLDCITITEFINTCPPFVVGMTAL